MSEGQKVLIHVFVDARPHDKPRWLWYSGYEDGVYQMHECVLLAAAVNQEDVLKLMPELSNRIAGVEFATAINCNARGFTPEMKKVMNLT